MYRKRSSKKNLFGKCETVLNFNMIFVFMSPWLDIRHYMDN